jgi:hypothetical protein
VTHPPTPARRGLFASIYEAHRMGPRLDRPTGAVNPYEEWVFWASALAGILSLTPIATPVSLDEAAWPGFQLSWGIIHTAAAAAALTGLYWPGQPVTAIYVKRAGIVGLAGTFMAYAVALLTVTGPTGVVVGIELLGLSVACLVRAIQISRIVRKIVARSAVLDATDAYAATTEDERRRRQEPPA